tara:strand:+ start:2301 stop:3053 length:753 start_codon:yes stop_codon:yes gene_type:complete
MQGTIFFNFILITLFGMLSCNSDNDSGPSITDPDQEATLHAAFAEFDENNTDIYMDGSEFVIETNGMPNHTTTYWGEGHEMYLDEPNVNSTPSIIPNFDASATLRISADPQKAASTSSTRLGPIGISVSGAAIFNGEEGNGPLSNAIVSIDHAGGHIGPGVYHYHLEPSPLSNNDTNLVGIMADGFFIYGRKCHATNGYPTDLDVSGGHSSVTQHTNESEYHYHIINEFYTGTHILIFGGDYQGIPNAIN